MDKLPPKKQPLPPLPGVEQPDDGMREKMIAAIKVNNDAMRKGFMAGIQKGARDGKE